MNLAQRKLTKAEWEGIEIPVSMDEKKILNMIKNGFQNILLNFPKEKNGEHKFFPKNISTTPNILF